MRYKELVYQGKTYTEKYKIDEVLIAKKINWLIDAEVEDLRIEIHTKEDEYTLIINAGKWYNGIFQYGVIRDIEWLNGTFKNGVWYNGIWKNGIFEHGLIFKGKFYDGKILAGKIHGGDFFDVEISEKVQKIDQPVQQIQGQGMTQQEMPQVQTSQTQVQTSQTQVQTSGQTQAQTGQTQAQVQVPQEEVQKAVEALSQLDNKDSFYIKESILLTTEKEIFQINQNNDNIFKDVLLTDVLTNEEAYNAKQYAYLTVKQLYSVISMIGVMEMLNVDEQRFDQIIEILRNNMSSKEHTKRFNESINFRDDSSIKKSTFEVYNGSKKMEVIKSNLSYDDLCKYLSDNKHNLFNKYVRIKNDIKWWEADFFLKNEIDKNCL